MSYKIKSVVLFLKFLLNICIYCILNGKILSGLLKKAVLAEGANVHKKYKIK